MNYPPASTFSCHRRTLLKRRFSEAAEVCRWIGGALREVGEVPEGSEFAGIDPLRREQDVGVVVEFLHHAETMSGSLSICAAR